MGARRVLCALGALTVTSLAIPATIATAPAFAATTGASRTREVRAADEAHGASLRPRDAVGGTTELDSVACPATGACVAVGETATIAGEAPLLDQQVAGAWSGVAVPLPPGASTTGIGDAFDAVACAQAGDCVAVGSYTTARGTAALLVASTNGRWSAVAVPLPPGASTAPEDVLDAVTCPALRGCVAVGSYTRSDGAQSALLDVETSGRWAAVAVPLPADAATTPDDLLESVSCSASGDCAAVGTYASSAGQAALLDVDASGTWSNVVAPLPADAASAHSDVLDAVDCVDAQDCVAAGSYALGGGDFSALLDVETTGTWAAVPAPLPSSAGAAPNNSLNSLSCSDDLDCVAVGSYEVAPTEQAPLIDVETAGTWADDPAPIPADAYDKPFDSLSQVSCWAVGDCVAVGFYSGLGGFLYPEALLEVDLGGTWATGADSLPADADTHPAYSMLGGDACSGFLTCVAGGTYVDASRTTEALLQAVGLSLSPLPVAPSAPTGVTATAGHGQAKVSWRAPADDGGSAVARYVVTASPGGHQCTTHGATTCTVRPLAAGTRYSFTVTASTGLGSATSSPSATVVPRPVLTGSFAIRPFDEGSAALDAAAKAAVNAIASRVSLWGDTEVALTGFNDDRPSGAGGVALSLERARAVATYLRARLRRLGVGDVLITSRGLGSSEPVASNSTTDGRAQNRRVVATLQ